jgi:maltoporin
MKNRDRAHAGLFGLAFSACLPFAAHPGLGAEVSPDELRELREEFLAYKRASEARIKSLEDKLAKTETRAVRTAERVVKTETAVTQVGAMAEEAMVRAKLASGELQGTTEAFTDFGTKPPLGTFEFHGYLRSGVGISGEGRQAEAFQAPGAWAKYRLGNETETYGEALLRYNFPPLAMSPASWNVQIRMAFRSDEDRGFPDDEPFSLPEAFVQGRDVVGWLPGASFWAGARFYRRQDIHINDFKYSDARGYGGGVEDVDLGFGKMALAYMGSNKDDIKVAVPRLTKRAFDLRLYDIPALWGQVALWAAYGWVGGEHIDGVDVPRQQGPALGFLHTLKTPWDGQNRLSLQYGYDAFANLTSTGFVPPADRESKPHTWRVTDAYTFQPNEHFAMQAVFLYQNSRTVARGESADEWISAGMRPIWFFTKHTGIAFEAGWDYVKNDREKFEGSLYKLTLSPQLQYDNKFFGRPVIRLFGTYAFWDDSLKGRIGGETYRDATRGASFGLQAETWW